MPPKPPNQGRLAEVLDVLPFLAAVVFIIYAAASLQDAASLLTGFIFLFLAWDWASKRDLLRKTVRRLNDLTAENEGD